MMKKKVREKIIVNDIVVLRIGGISILRNGYFCILGVVCLIILIVVKQNIKNNYFENIEYFLDAKTK